MEVSNLETLSRNPYGYLEVGEHVTFQNVDSPVAFAFVSASVLLAKLVGWRGLLLYLCSMKATEPNR